MDGATIRPWGAADRQPVLDLYRDAFPEEDLTNLVSRLTKRADVTGLVAENAGEAVGFMALTDCRLAGRDITLCLLGPLAVRPDLKARGLGGQLVRAGIDRARDKGHAAICVLGNPDYYGRFDFRPEREIVPPYPLPEAWAEAWQSVWFNHADRAGGRLAVPEPWQDAALWS